MFKRFIASFVCLVFFLSNLHIASAQEFNINRLPEPGSMIEESAPFAPMALKGLIVNPQKPLEFQFIVDTGKGPQDSSYIREESNRLVKYFLAGLTIPEGELWVNLSPYEKDRITTASLGQTVLGRDLLAQDYILKQLTASLIYPEKSLGKAFWSKVYAKARKQFGTTNVPVNTFNKVWIMPDQAQVFENGPAAYVTKATLKVMLDEDYMARQKHRAVRSTGISSQIVRQIILPEIEKEVNTGRNFAPLRQIYGAMVLAKWYKQTIANGLLDAVYTNKDKTAGVDLSDPSVKEQIYERYIQAYKKGVFNYIKEDALPGGQKMPRKYFSGGITRLEPQRVATDGIITVKTAKADGAMMVLTASLTAAGNPAMSSEPEKFDTSNLLPIIQPEEAEKETSAPILSIKFKSAPEDGPVTRYVLPDPMFGGGFVDERVFGQYLRTLQAHDYPQVRNILDRFFHSKYGLRFRRALGKLGIKNITV
ncbi:MAG: hypothetical protein KGJ11_04205, partial [Candidatus Omnitrophica bacterium]|nr:hypothetical protein [Candidatus Omnitrophota bacterium]